MEAISTSMSNTAVIDGMNTPNENARPEPTARNAALKEGITQDLVDDPGS